MTTMTRPLESVITYLYHATIREGMKLVNTCYGLIDTSDIYDILDRMLDGFSNTCLYMVDSVCSSEYSCLYEIYDEMYQELKFKMEVLVPEMIAQADEELPKCCLGYKTVGQMLCDFNIQAISEVNIYDADGCELETVSAYRAIDNYGGCSLINMRFNNIKGLMHIQLEEK